MSAKKSIYIGLMSGTSLDGIDAVAVVFAPEFQLIATHTEDIPLSLKANISRLMQPGDNEIDLLGETDRAFGQLLAKSVNNLIAKNHINRNQVCAIGSHGQTIRHRPESGFSLQIGDPNVISENTTIATVADMRRRDMAAGGQGAPLVPGFHAVMFQSKKTDRILLNIGGMANITFLPRDKQAPLAGFDTGPGNILLNAWIEKHLGKSFDNNGGWAASGNINADLLQAMLDQNYFRKVPPKSTGRELFNLQWLENILSDFPSIPEVDVQATLVALTVNTIAESINLHIPSHNYELYVCGGGSHNTHLMLQLEQALPGIMVAPSGHAGLNADWMEACAFAWLAKQCLEGKTGNVSSATGAQGNRILGAIYQA